MNLKALGPLMAAGVLLIIGAWRAWAESGTGQAVLIIGAVVLGVSLALAVLDWERDRHKNDEDPPPKKKEKP